MRRVIVVLAMLLASCSGSKAEKKEREFAIFDQGHVDAAERCRKLREVADAWLEAENKAKFDQWNDRADHACAVAQAIPNY